MSLPSIISEPKYTSQGTPYLTHPGIVMISRPSVDMDNIRTFLDGFDRELKFLDYVSDTTVLPDGTQLSKLAGQLCYMSFGPGRTMNNNAKRYFDNIKSQSHGSVLEHTNYSFLLYGISRSITHELVRHRAGFAYSQVSQRYVDGKVLRFVERPEYQEDPVLHHFFIGRIDDTANGYRSVAEYLMKVQESGESEILSADQKTDLRKKVNQAARSLLPNETEAPIVVTANARAWRHFLEMRASEHAEVEIRRLAMGVYKCLVEVDPVIFGDYKVVELGDGTEALDTEYRKV